MADGSFDETPVDDRLPNFGASQSATTEVQRLAATRAALDPNHRKARGDILVSAIVELLATSEMDESRLIRDLNAMWRTTSITQPQVAAAINAAFSAHLISRSTDLSGVDRWHATPGAVEESLQDAKWADSILEQFRTDTQDRLRESGASLTEKMRDRIPEHLLRVLSVGAQSTFAIQSDDGKLLRPISFDIGEANADIRRVEPKAARGPLFELLNAAIDPNEPYANDVVHLLVVGNLLRGVLTKRDVGQSISLEGTRTLLDTSSLLDLVSQGLPTERVISQVISLSARLGVQVVVADHTVEEWDRVWDAANTEIQNGPDISKLPTRSHYLTRNPLISEFLRRHEKDSNATWQRFHLENSNLRKLLAGTSVLIRPAGNNTSDDLTFQESVRQEIIRLSEDPDTPGFRSKPGAVADAASCTMVARWREKSDAPECDAYFVAKATGGSSWAPFGRRVASVAA